MTRRARRLLKKIQRSRTHYELQEIASVIQTEVDRRRLTYDEALSLGNSIQAFADTIPGDTIVYAISDRDAYRKTLELYLKDGFLSRTEQLLLWEERRRLGISDEEHQKMLHRLVNQMARAGKSITVSRFDEPNLGGGVTG